VSRVSPLKIQARCFWRDL